MPVLIIILIIVLIVVAARGNRGWGMGYWGPGYRRDPLEIAKERYAKGEITKEQFDEIKKNLLT